MAYDDSYPGDFPELNMSNYDHDGVAALNAWGIQASFHIDRLLAALAGISLAERDTTTAAADKVRDMARIARQAFTGQEVPAPLPLMRAAFRTSVSDGRRYELRFKFGSLADMQAAEREWRAFVAAQPRVVLDGNGQEVPDLQLPRAKDAINKAATHPREPT